MRSLCALVFVAIAFVLIAAENSNAEPAQITNSVTVTSGKGALRASSNTETLVSGVQHRIDVSTARHVSGFRVLASLTSSQNDYSNYIVQDKIGNTQPLSNTFDRIETNALAGVDYAKGAQTVVFSLGQSVSESPFAQNSASAAYFYKFNQDLSAIGWALFRSQSEQPENYSTNTLNGKRVTLPTEVVNQNFQINYEQILTENMKFNSAVEYLTKTARPSALSLTGRVAYALSERDFLKYEFSRAEENSAELPADNQGIFSLIGNEITYNRYVTYDLLIGMSYGLTVESESTVGSEQVDQTASDAYGLNIAYQAKKFRIDIQSQLVASNTGYQSQTIGGKLEWVF